MTNSPLAEAPVVAGAYLSRLARRALAAHTHDNDPEEAAV